MVNQEKKSELSTKLVFDFVGYQFDLKHDRVQPTPDQWQTIQEKSQKLLGLLSTLQTSLSGPAADAPNKTGDSHRITGPPRGIPFKGNIIPSRKQSAH